MNIIEIIGWLATTGTLLSFAVKDMYKLRLINGISSLIWISYGILKMDNPIIVINSAVILMHLHWFYTNKNESKRNQDKNKRTKKENANVHALSDINCMYSWIRKIKSIIYKLKD